MTKLEKEFEMCDNCTDKISCKDCKKIDLLKIAEKTTATFTGDC